MQGTKNLDWYPKQISKGKYWDKKEICAGIFRAGDQIRHQNQAWNADKEEANLAENIEKEHKGAAFQTGLILPILVGTPSTRWEKLLQV